MKSVKFNYGRQEKEIDLPDSISWQELTRTQPDVADEYLVIKDTISKLLSLERVQTTLNLARPRITLVVPDHTRSCRLPVILPILLDAFQQQCQKNTNPVMQVLIANGTHELQPIARIRADIGAEIMARVPVVQHNCHDDTHLVYLGKTSFGTPVWLNRLVVDADLVITIGAVMYHYFAGFGGGPKMLVPGVSGYETCRINHRRTIDETTGDFHPNCYEGNICTNPVYLDLAEVRHFLPGVISVQLVSSPNKKIVHAAVGDPVLTHKEIITRVREIYELPLKDPADVVIASAGGYPADVNMIQLHKSIHHAFAAVKKNGVIIMLAECSEGIGSKTFMQYFDGSTTRQIGKRLLTDYQINGHTALALKQKTDRAHIFLVSELNDGLEKFDMVFTKNFEDAWLQAEKMIKRPAKGYILKNAALFVPKKVDVQERDSITW